MQAPTDALANHAHLAALSDMHSLSSAESYRMWYQANPRRCQTELSTVQEANTGNARPQTGALAASGDVQY